MAGVQKLIEEVSEDIRTRWIKMNNKKARHCSQKCCALFVFGKLAESLSNFKKKT